jgi:hypothetical protein
MKSSMAIAAFVTRGLKNSWSIDFGSVRLRSESGIGLHPYWISCKPEEHTLALGRHSKWSKSFSWRTYRLSWCDSTLFRHSFRVLVCGRYGHNTMKFLCQCHMVGSARYQQHLASFLMHTALSRKNKFGVVVWCSRILFLFFLFFGNKRGVPPRILPSIHDVVSTSGPAVTMQKVDKRYFQKMNFGAMICSQWSKPGWKLPCRWLKLDLCFWGTSGIN